MPKPIPVSDDVSNVIIGLLDERDIKHSHGSWVTSLDPAVRAIVVSGYAQDAAISSYRDFGFAAAMNKPYNLHELRATLENVIMTTTCRIH